MAFEDFKAPEASGSGAENKEPLDISADEEELAKMAKRIEELKASGGKLSDEEIAKLGEIIARGDEIVAAYKRHGYAGEDGEDGLSEISPEVAELMRRGEPYTPEEMEVMEAEAKRLEEKGREIIRGIEEDYEIDGELEVEE